MNPVSPLVNTTLLHGLRFPVTRTVAAIEGMSAEADILGTDIYFDGDVAVTPAGDYRLVSERENLRRAILRRFLTRPGEYRMRPTYGVGVLDFIKKPATSSRIAELKTRIIQNLEQEQRIDRVVSVEVSPLPNDAPGIVVKVVVESKGRELRFEPFSFRRSV